MSPVPVMGSGLVHTIFQVLRLPEVFRSVDLQSLLLSFSPIREGSRSPLGLQTFWVLAGIDMPPISDLIVTSHNSSGPWAGAEVATQHAAESRKAVRKGRLI